MVGIPTTDNSTVEDLGECHQRFDYSKRVCV